MNDQPETEEDIMGILVSYADVPDRLKPLKNVWQVYPDDTSENMPCDFFVIEHLTRGGKTHAYEVYYCKNDGFVLESWQRSCLKAAQACAEDDVGHTLTWHDCQFELPEAYWEEDKMFDRMPRVLFP